MAPAEPVPQPQGVTRPAGLQFYCTHVEGFSARYESIAVLGPDVRQVRSDGEEERVLVERVRELLADTPAEEIAVVSKHRRRVHAAAQVLTGAGIDNTVLDGDGPGPKVRVATMHRVKGLDFSHVIMHLPGPAAQSRDPRDKSLLYVAATRCRKTLTVIVNSPHLPRSV